MDKSIIKILINRNTDLTKLHFCQEYLGAMTFSPFYPQIFRKALQSAYQIIVYNDVIANIIRPYNQRIQITPSGIDVNRFYVTEKVPAKVKRILFSGRVDDPVKGFSVVKKACRRLWKERTDFELIVTSSETGFNADPYIKSVGWLSQEDLPILYQSSDICLVPSIWQEAFGITALEAMACGKPVIASNIGGLKNIVIDGVTGFTIPPNDADALYSKMKLLLDDSDLRKKLGGEGRKRVEQEFDWNKILDKYYLNIFSS
ncbi:MAG: glycosyltransferase family 4 protein [bacterium]|nr:glycosyltransferase family 4 protein [bacterium]